MEAILCMPEYFTQKRQNISNSIIKGGQTTTSSNANSFPTKFHTNSQSKAQI